MELGRCGTDDQALVNSTQACQRAPALLTGLHGVILTFQSAVRSSHILPQLLMLAFFCTSLSLVRCLTWRPSACSR